MTENILTELYYGRIAPWASEPARGAAARELDLKIEKELQYFGSALRRRIMIASRRLTTCEWRPVA